MTFSMKYGKEKYSRKKSEKKFKKKNISEKKILKKKMDSKKTNQEKKGFLLNKSRESMKQKKNSLFILLPDQPSIQNMPINKNKKSHRILKIPEIPLLIRLSHA